MTYDVGGIQNVAVLAGWGGVFPSVAGELSEKSGKQCHVSRLLIYKLGGNASLPAPESGDRALNPANESAAEDTLSTGHALYANFCSDCHTIVALLSEFRSRWHVFAQNSVHYGRQ
jgi:mono/diheme cytochrome c family protein